MIFFLNQLLVFALMILSPKASHAGFWDIFKPSPPSANFEPLILRIPTTQGPFAWKIKKTEWSTLDEKNYQSFVARLGAAVEHRQCYTVPSCLRSSANVYASSDPRGLRFFADCAKFPYLLRAYFAWKNNLPWSVSTAVRPRPQNGPHSGDIRYSRYGNEVISRADFTTRGGFASALYVLNDVVGEIIFSANIRTYHESSDSDLLNDFYPVEISRIGVRPGTIIYDPDGHAVVIFKVTKDGRVGYIDAHPDETLTSGNFSKRFVRANPGQGPGFKNWRPIKLVGADLHSDGTYWGGKMLMSNNKSIADFSTVEYYGTQPSRDGVWSKGKFIVNGREVDWYEYVRLQLSEGNLRIDPIDDLKSSMKDICLAIQDRVVAVDEAIKSGIQNRSHPYRLPYNIYGADGEWETYSTPSRDAALKVIFKDLLDQTRVNVAKVEAHDPSVIYNGSDIKKDLINAYHSVADSCNFSYTNSRGDSITLNYETLRKRLFAISFDPYHCVEHRWGASGAELATCNEDADKSYWYKQEQYLRNQIERQYTAKMNYTAEELSQIRPGVGSATAPDTDLLRYLNQY